MKKGQTRRVWTPEQKAEIDFGELVKGDQISTNINEDIEIDWTIGI